MNVLKSLQTLGKHCTGCSACRNVCPADAIHMNPDRWGFLYPSVDESRCVGCGLCERVCPKLNPDTDNVKTPDCYALMADDEIRMHSSSGGAFTILAEWVLSSGGIVCGATMDESFVVRHICIDSHDSLGLLQKSKYVQSDVGLVYREIEEYAKSKRNVLFVGTPCQVAGLERLATAKGFRDAVLLVDFLCGGTPSPKMWHDYLDECHDITDITHVDFRPKQFG